MKWVATFLIGTLVGAFGIYVYPGIGQPKPLAIEPSRATAMAPEPPNMPVVAVAQSEPNALAVSASEPVTALPIVPAPVPMPASDDSVAVAGQLLIPVAGIHASALKDTFNDARGSERRHEAIDIAAPRGTQVLAVADGKLVKLFNSKPGGLTVYQFDTSDRFAYYYAHLDRYAADLKEGMSLKRGDLLGYVGASGNADPKTPHLHFAIFELEPQRQWWKGSPVNPYPLMCGTMRP